MNNFYKYLSVLSAVFLFSCEQDSPILPDADEDIDAPSVPPVQQVPEPVSSAVMAFCYYDIPGVVDYENSRIDFNMEVYGTDTPDLRSLPLTFALNEGFAIKDIAGNVANLTLNVKKPTKITFVSETDTLDYQIYVTPTAIQTSTTEFDFHAGVNLSYWFQESIPWPEEEVLVQAKELGFDHVRLPVDSYVLFDSNGNLKRDIMNQVHGVIRKCQSLSLKVIFDMHWLKESNMFYQEAAALELVNNWKKLMVELRGYPNDFLAYEILNEPFGPGWELMQRRMLHLIRHSEPERVIFVSPSGYNADGCAKLYMHKGDPNLVITFHYYEPMLASHRKLWGYKGPSHYPGYLFSDEEWNSMSDADKEIAQWHKDVYFDYSYVFEKMKACADQGAVNGLRVHCGEFGMSKENKREERILWFKDIVKAFNECGIVYTVWENWGGDFGPGNWASQPDEEVIDILLGRD